jgi:hypothetical protein
MANNEGRTAKKGAMRRREVLRAAAAAPAAAILSLIDSVLGETRPTPGSGRGQASAEYDPQRLNPYAWNDVPALGDLVRDKKFIWLDLRAFDNSAPGFGFPGYLGNLDFKPDAVFILLSNPGFVFLHNDLSKDAPLEQRFATYGGKIFRSRNGPGTSCEALLKRCTRLV